MSSPWFSRALMVCCSLLPGCRRSHPSPTALAIEVVGVRLDATRLQVAKGGAVVVQAAFPPRAVVLDGVHAASPTSSCPGTAVGAVDEVGGVASVSDDGSAWSFVASAGGNPRSLGIEAPRWRLVATTQATGTNALLFLDSNDYRTSRMVAVSDAGEALGDKVVQGHVHALTSDRDGETLYVVQQDGDVVTVSRQDATTFAERWVTPISPASAPAGGSQSGWREGTKLAIAATGDDRLLAVIGGRDARGSIEAPATLAVLDTASGKILHAEELSERGGPIRSVVGRPSGQHILLLRAGDIGEVTADGSQYRFFGVTELDPLSGTVTAEFVNTARAQGEHYARTERYHASALAVAPDGTVVVAH